MRPGSSPAGPSRLPGDAIPAGPTPVPSRLRRQLRPAAILLFSPALLALLFSWPLLRARPATTLALLPGLALAAHLHFHLARQLTANHGSGAADPLYPTLGAANWITLLRGAAAVALAGLLPLAAGPGEGQGQFLHWFAGCLYLGSAVADLVDGFVARRQGRETELGKQLDGAADAAGLLAASLLAVGLGRLPAFYLLAGLAYYPFILGTGLRRRRSLPLVPLPPRPYARTIAGFQMGLVGLALTPLIDPRCSRLAAWLFMTPLLAGFVWDWLIVSCRLQRGSDLHAFLCTWSQRIFFSVLPLALRLAILVGGSMTLLSGDLSTHPFLQALLGLCCLLAGSGLLGRSGALALSLLLGSSLSPLPVTVPSLLLFGSAATLMLTGTGALSLWSPEDRILSRDFGPGPG